MARESIEHEHEHDMLRTSAVRMLGFQTTCTGHACLEVGGWMMDSECTWQQGPATRLDIVAGRCGQLVGEARLDFGDIRGA
jgi:hypothetical protein